VITQHDTRPSTASATSRVDRAIVEVVIGRRSVDRCWHQMRAWQPTLAQWQAFASACRFHGRTTYSNRWALHQFRCWSELSDAGTYPQQRANWAIKQAAFERNMAAKSGRVRTNAEIRAEAAATAKPEPGPQQLDLLA
jgi:hypothetical protein